MKNKFSYDFDYDTVEDGYVIYDLNGKAVHPWNVIAALNKMPPELQLALTMLQENKPKKEITNE